MTTEETKNFEKGRGFDAAELRDRVRTLRTRFDEFRGRL
jgi:hypothetical protein